MKNSFVFIIMLLLLSGSAAAFPLNTRTAVEMTRNGYVISEDSELRLPSMFWADPSECVSSTLEPALGEIWHYTIVDGPIQQNICVGEEAAYVLAGGSYSGARMFQGIGGSGDVLWQIDEPVVGTNEYWVWWETGTEISETDEVCFAVSVWTVYNDNGTPANPNDDWLVSDDNCVISCYGLDSPIPDWTFDATGTFYVADADAPGMSVIAADTALFAVSGTQNGHLGILLFDAASDSPIMIYEDPAILDDPRQLRITSDGSKCIFRYGGTLYRVDMATGTLEDTYSLGASTDCFGVSPDGSVVAYGFTQALVATWNGTSYEQAWSMPVSGFIACRAVVASDNSTIYFGVHKSNYLSNRIIRNDISSSTPLWTFDYPEGSGGYQETIDWMDCSDDGRYVAVASWGCQTGGAPEINVFDDLNHNTPVLSLDTPGSMFDIDITADGQYIAATGKHVHANQMGNGTDSYFASVWETGIESGDQMQDSPVILHPVTPNPVSGSAQFSYTLQSAGSVSLNVYDASGHLVSNVTGITGNQGFNTAAIELDIESGIYFCRLNHETMSETRRFVVVR
ncbi:MAG: T9SS type A sorting domain-containing protein [Candidatus Fermentibacteria bacterium]